MRRVGGADELVAPKRKAEAAAADLTGDALLAWLAEGGKRVRRPIIDVGGKVLLGFAADARAALGALV